jgi:pheromone shutdown-related protein TraB
MLATEFPSVKSTLIDERDVYLSQKIKAAEGQKIVAVLGAGHVPGILNEIHKDTELEPLEQLPRRSLWPRLLQWGIPAAIIALLTYGFFKDGAEHSLESIWIWVLVNGSLSALGALLALGHPITILTAFLAAPLTSLNPLIAAGWVSGLAQAFVKKPTVEDLENLPDAISTVKGFWLNPVSRILLVVVLSNLGSTLGTFIGGSWIAGRSLS